MFIFCMDNVYDILVAIHFQEEETLDPGVRRRFLILFEEGIIGAMLFRGEVETNYLRDIPMALYRSLWEEYGFLLTNIGDETVREARVRMFLAASFRALIGDEDPTLLRWMPREYVMSALDLWRNFYIPGVNIEQRGQVIDFIENHL